VVHLVGIPVTGTSVNPARSLGPALVVGGTALAQVWLFIVAPLAGGVWRPGCTGRSTTTTAPRWPPKHCKPITSDAPRLPDPRRATASRQIPESAIG
jgi:Major intrinsic protein